MNRFGGVNFLTKKGCGHEAADKLQTTLDEEGKADRKLTAIAESQVNPDAAA